MRLLIKSTRTVQADAPFDPSYGREEYRVEIMHTRGGGRLQPGRSHRAQLDWSQLLPELESLRAGACDVEAVARLGDRLRHFLGDADWSKHEAAIGLFLEQMSEVVHITVVSDAAEMYLLPWELLTLQPQGIALGALERVIIGHAWLETRTLGPAHAHPGRVLMVWSGAGGRVPTASHIDALAAVCAQGGIEFDQDRDVVPDVTRRSLEAALAADTQKRPTALHILCHGSENGELLWGPQMDASERVPGTSLGALITPFAERLVAVTVCACDAGNPGLPGRQTGSVVQALHRAGVPWVMGARYPLDARASVAVAEAFYGALCGRGTSAEAAFARVRHELVGGGRDVSSVQLYARDEVRGGSAGTRDERGPGSPSVAGFVTELIELLSRKRSTPDGNGVRGELAARVDELAAAIRARFRPSEGAMVAGARLDKVIGVGNFGTVWQAVDVDSGEQVAVKVFRLERLTLGQMAARFRRSIRAMRLLSERRRLERKKDPRGLIAGFYKADESTLAFSMTMVPGGNLEHVDRFSWPLERKLEIVVRVCAAVRYSHANGVIHRDIKPANILLSAALGPVLTDFDISDIKWATSLSTSVEGTLGTPVFAAPEQLESADSATERSDIYSLGRLLYYLLLERSPGYQVEKDPSLDNLAAFPPAVVEVVRRCTQYDQRRRYGSVRELIGTLERCHTGAAAWRARVSRTCRWMGRHWAPLAIIAVLLIGLASFAEYQRRAAHAESLAHQEADRQRKRAEEAGRQLFALTKRVREIESAKVAYADQLNTLRARRLELDKAQARVEESSTRWRKLERQIADNLQRQEEIATKQRQLNEELKSLDLELQQAAKDTQATPQPAPVVSSSLRAHDDFERDCQNSEGCVELGYCHEGGDRCVAATDDDCRNSRACLQFGTCTARHGECTVGSDAECAKGPQCEKLGSCQLWRGGCVADADSECRSDSMCTRFGRCTAVDGECVAGAIDDCQSSSACRSSGLCALQGRVCTAGSDGDCRYSTDCRTKGECSAKNGQCVADSDDDCRRSGICASFGLCVAREGICMIGAPEDCRASNACDTEGRCTAKGGRCVAGSDEDCANSKLCKQYDACSEFDHICVSLRVHCANWPLCRVDGLCGAVDAACAARDDKDCQKSEGCKNAGRCEERRGECVVGSDDSCRALPACPGLGLCTAVGGECVAGSEADCRESLKCRENAWCTVESGQCVVGADADCRRSELCLKRGLCTLAGDSCASQTDRDCHTSLACRQGGRCTAQGGKCVAISPRDCRRAALCKKSGLCQVDSGECIAGDDMSCRASAECKEMGWCSVADGECVAQSNRDCRRAQECLRKGRCVAEDGDCIAGSDEDCQTSLECKQNRRCSERNGTCVIDRRHLRLVDR